MHEDINLEKYKKLIKYLLPEPDHYIIYIYIYIALILSTSPQLRTCVNDAIYNVITK